MQQYRRARPGLRHGARAVGGLARFQHAPAGPGGRIQRVRRPAGLAPARLHAGQPGKRTGHIGDEGLPSGTELRCQRLRFRPVGGYVKAHRIASVDQSRIRVQQPDLAALPLDGRFDRLLAEQAIDDPYILLQIGQLHRAQPHCAAARETRADPEVDAPRREPVQGSEGVRGDGGDPVGGNQHAGAKADARGLHRRGAHRHETVGGDHLGVEEPRVREAELLCPLRQSPGIRRRGDADAELHAVPPQHYWAAPWARARYRTRLGTIGR